MKFFFPNSNDIIDPTFDFVEETRSRWRIPYRDDLHPHEVFSSPPYDGILVSKAIVDGIGSTGGKFSLAQKHRIYRSGVKKYFRIEGLPILTMGDCGAFSYVNEVDPPVTVSEVIEFYGACQFDYGLSVDHVILGYSRELDNTLPGLSIVSDDWKYRRMKTLELAQDFLLEYKRSNYAFTPVGVAQGWSPKSYADSVKTLEEIGYKNIAIGGLVPLKSDDILNVVKEVGKVIDNEISIHLLGVTRLEFVNEFIKHGVTSFDSTSPFRQAFLDAKDNYHFKERTYRAIRVPQSDKNAKLSRQIRSGIVDPQKAINAENKTLNALRAFGSRKISLNQVLETLRSYEEIYSPQKSQIMYYEESLRDRPWENCSCDICEKIGIEVIIFRGSERNKRRGFHNLSMFYKTLRNVTGT